MDAAVLLRNMSGISYRGMNNPFVDLVAPILTESPKLDERWWLSEPLMYRGPNGMTEIWPAPIKAKISETAVRVLERADSDSSMVVQACMILANGAVLTGEKKTAVLASLQRRLEDASNSSEALTAMVAIPESFVHLTGLQMNRIRELSQVDVQIEIRRTSEANRSLVSCSVVMQLLSVVHAIDHNKACQPQLQKVFDASRDVFDIVSAQRQKNLDGPEGPLFRAINKPQSAPQMESASQMAANLFWPGLTTNVDLSVPVPPGPPHRQDVWLFKALWGDHVPSKEDWLKYLILLHPAMKETVADALEKSK